MSTRRWFRPIALFSLLVGFSASEATSSGIRQPFPRSAVGGALRGIRPSGATASASEVQALYEKWLATYYAEGSCGSDPCARIRWDDSAYTVSEGIGYGMLIMVMMDNASNATREKFDKLWRYYRRWENAHGLMDWKIGGFASIEGTGAATDAELDVALALALAGRQWNDSAYLTAARALVDSMYKYEVDKNKALKPGDAWNGSKNPSYVSTAAMRVFDSLPGQNGRWSMVVEKGYNMLRRNSSVAYSASRLPSEWCDSTGKPVLGNGEDVGIFGYEAVRVPWRMATAYQWYGDTAARSIASNMAAFALDTAYPIGGKVPNIRDGYYQKDGTLFTSPKYGSWYTVLFVGCFGAAGLVDSKYQAWVDSCYGTLVSSKAPDYYYDNTLQLMYALLMSGNFSDLWGIQIATGNVKPGTRRMGGMRILRSGSTVDFRIDAVGASVVRVTDLEGRLVAVLPVVEGSAKWNLAGSAKGAYRAVADAPDGRGASEVFVAH